MPFKPGQSGNPKGRPRGNRNALTALRKAIADAIPEIIETVVSQAKAGDVTAAKLLIDRVCPPLKAQAVPIALPANGTLTDQGAEVIRATMNGQISPDIGSQLIAALASQSKIVEIDELTRRIEALENRS